MSRICSAIKSLSFDKLEWAGIDSPSAALVVDHYLIRGSVHGMFHSTLGIVVLTVLVGLAIGVFSRSMFRAINKYQCDLEGVTEVVASQNGQLCALNEANLALSEESLVSSVRQRVLDLSRAGLGATDIAVSLGVLALLGNRIHLSLKVFLSAFAIADDIGVVTGLRVIENLNSGAFSLLVLCHVPHVAQGMHAPQAPG